jgi:hypothetical protein
VVEVEDQTKEEVEEQEDISSFSLWTSTFKWQEQKYTLTNYGSFSTPIVVGAWWSRSNRRNSKFTRRTRKFFKFFNNYISRRWKWNFWVWCRYSRRHWRIRRRIN